MISFKTITAICLGAMFCAAQPIDISGVVKDSASGAPVTGAVVRLVVAGLKDTTGSDGKFQLKSPTASTIGSTVTGFSAAPVVNEQGIVTFDITGHEQVKIHTYSVQGKLVKKFTKTVEAGRHTLALPQPAAGKLLHRITVGGVTYTHTTIKLGNGQTFSSVATSKSDVSAHTTLSKQMAIDFRDTIVVMLAGIVISRKEIAQPIIVDYEIKPAVYFSVTYDGNGKTGGTVPATQVKTQGVALRLATNSGNLVKTGYTFDGWNTTANGNGINYAAGARYMADTAIILYAKWTTYTVTYDGNSNTGGTVPAAQVKTKGVVLTLAVNSGNLVKTGYRFVGWNTSANGSGTNYALGASYTVDSSVILFAKWISDIIVAGPTVTDADGNVYTSIVIGTQKWTVENLKTTKYNDGSAIPYVTDNSQWAASSIGAYCYYNNDIANKDKYGALYNWYAVSTGKLAPAGWRVPTDADWTTLENYLITNGYNWDGSTSENKIAKSLAAKTNWASNSGEGVIGFELDKNNASGFSALPGGNRWRDGYFLFQTSNGYNLNQSARGFWWSATASDASSAIQRELRYDLQELRMSGTYKNNGFSVRLMRN